MAIRVVEITESLSRKVNLGNYQSMDVFVAAKAELTDGTSTELRAAHVKLKDDLEHCLREQLALVEKMRQEEMKGQ